MAFAGVLSKGHICSSMQASKLTDHFKINNVNLVRSKLCLITWSTAALAIDQEVGKCFHRAWHEILGKCGMVHPGSCELECTFINNLRMKLHPHWDV